MSVAGQGTAANAGDECTQVVLRPRPISGIQWVSDSVKVSPAPCARLTACSDASRPALAARS